MRDAPSILDRIAGWARVEPDVRALVLVGSRAGYQAVDDLADFDVQVYVEKTEPYVRDDAWLTRFAPIWVCVHDVYRHNNLTVQTRLVIYEGGTKVDFGLIPVEALMDMRLDDPVRRVLVDKDGLVSGSFREPARPVQPDATEFGRIIREFWFEAYHVAKYLARGDLWPTKARDWETKKFLLKMIEWHAGATQGWNVDTYYMGKQMRAWVARDVWEELDNTFSHFDAEDSWRGLRATTRLFRRIAKETAAALNMTYPDDVDRNISGFIAGLEPAKSKST